jgi:hypothetical protein
MKRGFFDECLMIENQLQTKNYKLKIFLSAVIKKNDFDFRSLTTGK